MKQYLIRSFQEAYQQGLQSSHSRWTIEIFPENITR